MPTAADLLIPAFQARAEALAAEQARLSAERVAQVKQTTAAHLAEAAMALPEGVLYSHPNDANRVISRVGGQLVDQPILDPATHTIDLTPQPGPAVGPVPGPVRPAEPPAPIPAPIPPAPPKRSEIGSLVLGALLGIGVIGAGSTIYLHVFPQPVPGPSRPTDPIAALGYDFRAELANAYADASVATATAAESGKSVADAEKAFLDTFDQERKGLVQAKLAPEFSKVVPEGTTDFTAEQRKNYAAMYRKFAHGLNPAKYTAESTNGR